MYAQTLKSPALIVDLAGTFTVVTFPSFVEFWADTSVQRNSKPRERRAML
jgi:hypothetical protein